MMIIRAYRTDDTAVLRHIHNQTHPTPWTDGRFARYVADVLGADGRIWVITNADEDPIGYALTAPIPGLPGQIELDGGILPAWQRQGYGSALLQHVRQHAGPVHLSYCVASLDSPAAHFLQRRGFTVEHEEWVLGRPSLNELLPIPERSDGHCAPFVNRRRAIHTFCALYDASFAAHPWYQPYTAAEVDATLVAAQDILFLRRDDIPIGFAWLHIHDGVGEIEPFGIVDGWQGLGYGRFLLTAVLHQLAQRGATTAQIGAWHNNHPALHLYQSLGFQHHHTQTYLTL